MTKCKRASPHFFKSASYCKNNILLSSIEDLREKLSFVV